MFLVLFRQGLWDQQWDLQELRCSLQVASQQAMTAQVGHDWLVCALAEQPACLHKTRLSKSGSTYCKLQCEHSSLKYTCLRYDKQHLMHDGMNMRLMRNTCVHLQSMGQWSSVQHAV